MASINISVKTDRLDYTDFTKSSQAKENVQRVVDFLQGLVHGAAQGEAVIVTGSADPVAASQTIVCDFDTVTATDTISLLGVTLTCVDDETPGTAEFDQGTTDATLATNLAAAINAHSTLTKHVVASASDATVTITLRVKGAIGNLMRQTTATVGSGTPFTISGSGYFTSGAGSDSGSVSTLSRG